MVEETKTEQKTDISKSDFNKLKRKVSSLKSSKIPKSRFNPNIVSKPQIQLSAGQRMLNELFNGQPTFGTGNNLPIINNTLTSGNGLIKTGDFERRTGRMFGLR